MRLVTPRRNDSSSGCGYRPRIPYTDLSGIRDVIGYRLIKRMYYRCMSSIKAPLLPTVCTSVDITNPCCTKSVSRSQIAKRWSHFALRGWAAWMLYTKQQHLFYRPFLVDSYFLRDYDWCENDLITSISTSMSTFPYAICKSFGAHFSVYRFTLISWKLTNRCEFEYYRVFRFDLDLEVTRQVFREVFFAIFKMSCIWLYRCAKCKLSS